LNSGYPQNYVVPMKAGGWVIEHIGIEISAHSVDGLQGDILD
jgi:hypothetical protein